MCGIAGFLDLSKARSPKNLSLIARAMGDKIRHRGPDEGQEWLDAQAGVAFAHRRLSIIDLSAAGRQPMISSSGRYVLIFNGEIYNFQKLRKSLETIGTPLKGHSDTEVLLETLACWGVEDTLPRLIGMFAFALWDREKRVLVLARDRLGIKPLYWGRQGNHLFFASELKCLFAHPDFRPEVDRAALSDMVAFNYIPGPRSIYAGISHLPPGCFIRIDPDCDIQMKQYWDVVSVVNNGIKNQISLSDADATAHLELLLGEAISDRMVSDVPLGAFLSGGVDSSTVTALMQSLSASPVKTFTVGFEENSFSEVPHARAIADYLGTDHHEIILSSREALDIIPILSEMYCEPFADSSQIPTHLVSAIARKEVTVALSGDGGDEVFAGYNRYLAGQTLWPRATQMPMPVRELMAWMLRTLPHSMYDGLADMLPRRLTPPLLGDKMSKVADLLDSRSLNEFHARAVRFWKDASTVVIDGTAGSFGDEQAARLLGMPETVDQMQLLDMLTYLPGDILTKVDRASMAVGLEARVPLLDHRVIEFMSSLPTNMKIRGGETKWLLRRVLDGYVPRRLIDRPKMGFAIPLGEWLRGPLRDWAEDLLSEEMLMRTGLFHPNSVREKWHRHLSGSHFEHYSLWSILMAQNWYLTWMMPSEKPLYDPKIA